LLAEDFAEGLKAGGRDKLMPEERFMKKTAAAIVSFCITAALLPPALCAQSSEDPILVVSSSQTGKSTISCQDKMDVVYRLCANSRALYQKRRSVRGLKPGEKLLFYASIIEGRCSDSSGSSAVVSSLGDGRTLTVARNKKGDKKSEEDEGVNANTPGDVGSVWVRRTADGAILRVNLPEVSDLDLGAFYGVHDANANMTREQRDNYLTWKLSEAELGNWENLNKGQSGGAPGLGNGEHWEYSASVTARIPDLGEVAVEIDDYDEWIPEGNVKNASQAGNEITVRAWVCKTGDPETRVSRTAVITFELEKVGQEKGVCANWPYDLENRTMRPDLAIDEDRNRNLEMVILDREAKTKGPVKEAKAVVSAFDYGAWGVLKVTARDKDGKPIRVVYRQRKDSSDISIPKDEDHNHIADAWQEEQGAVGLPADWDEAAVSGQDVKGDGLSLYQKYRGLVVLDDAGGERYVRLDPKEKAHFVIDPDGLLDVNRWFEATGIRAFKVLEKWTNARQVDRNRGFAGLNGKWASKIVNRVSPNDADRSPDEMITVQENWGTSVPVAAGVNKPIWTPKDVEECRVYVDRIGYDLRFMKANIEKCLTAPVSPREKARGQWLMTLGLTRREILDRLAGINDAGLEALVKKLARQVAIHECAHSCGVNGHLERNNLKDRPKETVDSEVRVTDCPMQYCSWGEKCRMLLLGEMFGDGRLCDADPQHCWRHVSSKD
jgi:hypothetical protein